MKRCFVTVLVLMLFALSSCASMEEKIVGVEHITSKTSPDGLYTVSLYQIGAPEWPFGPVKAKLVLTDSKGKELDEERFSLLNDGTGVYEGNIVEISWLEGRAEILMDEADTTQTYTYVLYYGK